MTAVILAPRYRSRPRVQFETIELLRQNLGPIVSRDVMDRTFCEISDRMCRLHPALGAENREEVRVIAKRLAAIGRQVGLNGFSDVAADLADCIARGDDTAAHAVASRLIRLGESSMLLAEQFAETDRA